MLKMSLSNFLSKNIFKEQKIRWKSFGESGNFGKNCSKVVVFGKIVLETKRKWDKLRK